MKKATKQKLLEAWDWCDEEDKSTEFMLQYMADTANISYDRVVDYIVSDQAEIDRIQFYKDRGELETVKVLQDNYNKAKNRKK